MRTPWAAAALVVLALLFVGSIDRARTSDKIPSYNADNALQRFERARELDRDFDRRVWIYGGIAAVAMALAAAAALARVRPSKASAACSRRRASRGSSSESAWAHSSSSAGAAGSIRRGSR
jgi:hypothetical protein